MPSRKYFYTEEDLQEACKKSTTITEVCEIIGVPPIGKTFDKISKDIKYLNINISHFKYRRIQPIGVAKPVQYYLDNKAYIGSAKLRKKLIKENLLDPICNICKREEWEWEGNTINIPLDLHHINGNNIDNILSNLQLLCPNCHRCTDNHGSKNKKQINKTPIPGVEYFSRSNTKRSTICWPNKEDLEFLVWEKNMESLAKELHVSATSIRSKCKELGIKIPTNRYWQSSLTKEEDIKIQWPTNDILYKLVWERPTTQIAKELKVSDKAIQQRCKKYNIPKPGLGYWAKKRANKV